MLCRRMLSLGWRIATLQIMAASLLTARLRAQSEANPSASSVVLRPGDVLRVQVWKHPEMSGDFPIANDGTIAHPLYRELKVAGLPLPAIEQEIRSFLAQFETNPTFVVIPLMRVVAAGEVRLPNIYTVPPGTTVAQVVFMAGGPTDRGITERVRLVRGATTATFDITQAEGNSARAQVISGDEIIVPRRRSIMQDVIAPSSGILAALASVTGVIIQVTRK